MQKPTIADDIELSLAICRWYLQSVDKPVDSPDSVQGVAANTHHLFAIAKRSISAHEKSGGKPVSRWQAEQGDHRFVDLSSGVIHKERLYTAHSNRPGVPVKNSTEIVDIAPLQHLKSHLVGTSSGWFNWLDRRGDSGGKRLLTTTGHSAGQASDVVSDQETAGTVIVKMEDDFRIAQSWVLPASLLMRLAPMSNSSDSWGPDSRLYLSGHDRAEL